MLNELTICRFKMRLDEGVVDFMQGTGKLFAVLTAPFLSPDQPSDLPARE